MTEYEEGFEAGIASFERAVLAGWEGRQARAYARGALPALLRERQGDEAEDAPEFECARCEDTGEVVMQAGEFEACDRCQGDPPALVALACERCRGGGRIWAGPAAARAGILSLSVACACCNGTGTVLAEAGA